MLSSTGEAEGLERWQVPHVEMTIFGIKRVKLNISLKISSDFLTFFNVGTRKLRAWFVLYFFILFGRIDVERKLIPFQFFFPEGTRAPRTPGVLQALKSLS